MLAKIHWAITAVLLLAVATFAGLTVAGVLRYQPSGVTNDNPTEVAETISGRYRIEKVDDAREVIEAAGMGGFFGPKILEAWVFKYSGGYLQVKLQAEYQDEIAEGEPLPADWPPLLQANDALKENSDVSLRREGYIILTATPSQMPIDEAIQIYSPQLAGSFATATGGPLQMIFPLCLELLHKRPYRLFLSGRPTSGTPGHGYNFWAVHLLPIREPVLPRDLFREEFYVGGGKDLQPAKDITLLERKRGNSRIKLKARFLPDAEVRELATTKSDE